MSSNVASSSAQRDIELAIGGMTCASCARRVERRLNKLDGVSATVNYATEKAKVSFPAALDPAELVRTVEAAGYSAELPRQRAEDDADESAGALRRRLVIAAVLSVPVILLAMIPALQFDYWQWVSLVLATPVVSGRCTPLCSAARGLWG